MGTQEKRSWEVYLEGDVIGKETIEGYRVYQVVIRVRGEGLLGIVKARRGAEYQVCFVGAATLALLSAKVRDAILKETKKWKTDEYPPT